MSIRRVAVLIPSWNGRQHLETCLPAVMAQRGANVEVEVFVFDNGSGDGTAAWLEESHPSVRVVASPLNVGFATAINRLVEAATDADAVALLNNDTRPDPRWLNALVEALADAPEDVAAVSGRIVDWKGERLDFAEGLLTFDGHAFQRGYRRLLTVAELPGDGAELLFACGANLLIRREVFREVGGFDDDYFAYFEDVDLGWRLWLAGWRILFASEAVVHHRSMATSELLGRFHRGFLFEKNAFLTTFKNYDEEYFAKLMPAVNWTLMARTQTLLVHQNPGGSHLWVDPFEVEGRTTPIGAESAIPPPTGKPSAGPETPSALRRNARSILDRWRRFGPRHFLKRGLAKAASLSLAGGAPIMTDPQTVGHLRAMSYLIRHGDRSAAKRLAVQALRRRPDREIFERFGLWIVPTYPGDRSLLQGPGFEAWLPGDVPFERAELADLMEIDA